jgi:polysaccharide export outer membrane protein
MIIPDKRISAVLLSLLFIFASCVPNRKVTMLQSNRPDDDPVLKANRLSSWSYETGVSSYLLKVNDLLDIKISTMTPTAFNPFNDADRTLVPGAGYSQSGQFINPYGYYIDSDGFLDLPILGKVRVGGLTIERAQDTISTVVRKYLERPVVRLKLLNFRVSVLGEVKAVSTIQANDNTLTLLQALASAGGASEFGDLSQIKIIRQSGDKTFVFYANLLTEDYLKSPYFYLEPNDVIIVPPLKQRPYLKYVSPNLSIFATAVSLMVAVFSLLQLK